MTRVYSSLLMLAGLAVATTGLGSVWTTWNEDRVARRQWEQQIAARPAAPASPAVDRPAAIGEAMARLSIPGLNKDWVVIEGAGKRELKRGPGRLRDSAMPGARGNCVIAGHRDTHFRALRGVKPGDQIRVERKGRAYTYRVTGTEVVAPTDTRSLDPTPTPTLTLVTCYPFYFVGPAPKRFVVRAELVPSVQAMK